MYRKSSEGTFVHYDTKSGIAPDAEFILGTKHTPTIFRFSPRTGALRIGSSNKLCAEFSSILAGFSSIIRGEHNSIIAGVRNEIHDGTSTMILGSSDARIEKSQNVVVSGVDGRTHSHIPSGLRNSTIVQNLHVLGGFNLGWDHNSQYQLYVSGKSAFAGDASFGSRVLIAEGVQEIPLSRYRLEVWGDQAVSGNLDVRPVEGVEDSGNISARSISADRLAVEDGAVIGGDLTVRGTINGGSGAPFIVDYSGTEPATYDLEPQMQVIYVSTTTAQVTLALPSHSSMEGRDNQRLVVKDIRLLIDPNTNRPADGNIIIKAPEGTYIDTGFSTPTGSILPTYQPESGGTFTINRDQASVEFLYNETLNYWALISVFQGSVVEPAPATSRSARIPSRRFNISTPVFRTPAPHGISQPRPVRRPIRDYKIKRMN